MTTAMVAPRLGPGRLATLVASRFVLNAVFRVAYPLVPFIALRFGVSDAAATWIVTIQVVFGLISPLAGWLGDRIGLRTTMLIGLLCAAIGALGVAVAPSLTLLIAAFGLCGIGLTLYQPVMQAYVSALTSFEERGRAVGIVELSWALSGMVAVPPLLWLIRAQDSLAGAFAIVAASLLVIVMLTVIWLPSEGTPIRSTAQQRNMFATVLRNSSVTSFMLFIFLTIGSWEILFVAQAPWATARFNADLEALSLATFMFGVGELIGSFGSAVLTDRLGKRRGALIGFGLAAALYVFLPVISVTWIAYLIGYLLLAIVVEFGIVASLTLASTVSVVGRATVMALTVTAIQVGRALASQIGVPVLEASSIYVNGALAGGLTVVAILIALRWTREHERAGV